MIGSGSSFYMALGMATIAVAQLRKTIKNEHNDGLRA